MARTEIQNKLWCGAPRKGSSEGEQKFSEGEQKFCFLVRNKIVNDNIVLTGEGRHHRRFFPLVFQHRNSEISQGANRKPALNRTRVPEVGS